MCGVILFRPFVLIESDLMSCNSHQNITEKLNGILKPYAHEERRNRQFSIFIGACIRRSEFIESPSFHK